jgi:hypothetical protein
MGVQRKPVRKAQAAPFYIQLRRRDESGDELWSVRLESTLLTLLDPAERSVLTLSREEAPRYIRFAYRVPAGRSVTFVIIEGLKSYAFRCDKTQFNKLIAWLPHKELDEVSREVRQSSFAVAVFGIAQILMAAHHAWIAGASLLVAGIIGVTKPQLRMYLVNGVLMLLAGAWHLMPSVIENVDPRVIPPVEQMVPVILGSVLVLWGIQQLAMLTPNHKLRAARAIRDSQAAFHARRSDVVARLSKWNGYAAAAFVAYAVLAGGRWLLMGRDGGLTGSIDLAVFAVLAAVSAVFAHRLRQEPPKYTEAKVATQLAMAGAVFGLWGFLLNLDFARPLSAIGAVFSKNPSLLGHIYMWGTLILGVLVFNRWYGRQVDHELEEQRDE